MAEALAPVAGASEAEAPAAPAEAPAPEAAAEAPAAEAAAVEAEPVTPGEESTEAE